MGCSNHYEINITIAEKRDIGKRSVINARQRRRAIGMEDLEDHRNIPFWPRSHYKY